MKKLIAFFALLLLAHGAFAITLKSASASYEKGSEIIFTGTCDEGMEHRLRAEAGGAVIFDEQVNCFHSEFEQSYLSSFLDPSGNWKVTLLTEENGAEVNETSIVTIVEPVRESAYYRITFLSPAGFSFRRSEKISISIELTDSGKKVDGAEVVFFDVFGRRVNLKPEGNGIYDLNYTIPYNAATGEWSLVVTAKKTEGDKTFGGERFLGVGITNTAFEIGVIEPSKQNYEQSDPIPVKVDVFYPNGSTITPEKIESAELIVNSVKFPLEINSSNQLFTSYQPTFSGNQILVIHVKDIVGNEVNESVPIVVSCSATCMIKSYGLIVLVICLLLAVLVRLFYSKTKNSLELLSLEKEKEKTMKLIKNLQQEYFEKGVMPASSYKQNLAEYKARLIEAEQKLRQLRAKIESEK